MSPEGQQIQIEHSEPYEVSLGVPFKPFEKDEDFLKPDKVKPAPIPEGYDYAVLLQRKISYLGVEGYIDVISEDVATMAEIPVDSSYLEKPLGEVMFVLTMSKNDAAPRELPYILRLSFIARSPADYLKLLNSFVDVNIGDGEYILAWNINRPCVKENLKHLETGEEVFIVEKNIFNRTEVDDEVSITAEALIEFESRAWGRLGFVWLPDDLDKLRTIEFVFDQFGDDDDQLAEFDPSPPYKTKALVSV